MINKPARIININQDYYFKTYSTEKQKSRIEDCSTVVLEKLAERKYSFSSAIQTWISAVVTTEVLKYTINRDSKIESKTDSDLELDSNSDSNYSGLTIFNLRTEPSTAWEGIETLNPKLLMKEVLIENDEGEITTLNENGKDFEAICLELELRWKPYTIDVDDDEINKELFEKELSGESFDKNFTRQNRTFDILEEKIEKIKETEVNKLYKQKLKKEVKERKDKLETTNVADKIYEKELTVKLSKEEIENIDIDVIIETQRANQNAKIKKYLRKNIKKLNEEKIEEIFTEVKKILSKDDANANTKIKEFLKDKYKDILSEKDINKIYKAFEEKVTNTPKSDPVPSLIDEDSENISQFYKSLKSYKDFYNPFNMFYPEKFMKALAVQNEIDQVLVIYYLKVAYIGSKKLAKLSDNMLDGIEYDRPNEIVDNILNENEDVKTDKKVDNITYEILIENFNELVETEKSDFFDSEAIKVLEQSEIGIIGGKRVAKHEFWDSKEQLNKYINDIERKKKNKTNLDKVILTYNELAKIDKLIEEFNKLLETGKSNFFDSDAIKVLEEEEIEIKGGKRVAKHEFWNSKKQLNKYINDIERKKKNKTNLDLVILTYNEIAQNDKLIEEFNKLLETGKSGFFEPKAKKVLEEEEIEIKGGKRVAKHEFWKSVAELRKHITDDVISRIKKTVNNKGNKK